MANTVEPLRLFQVPTRALIGFFLLTFAITWGIVGMYIVAPKWSATTFGEISGAHPLFFLATWSPAISAFAIVFFFGGSAGFKAFLSRILLWRISPFWVAFILLGTPVVFMIGSLIKGGSLLAPLPPGGASAVAAFAFMMLFLGPIEEFGWRGIAQPILQRHLAPIWAGSVLGTIWGIWHLPAFLLSDTVFAGWNFFPFLIGNIALADLVTPIFNELRGSLLWPMIFHWQLIIPLWPDAQPYDTWLMVGLAFVVVWWKRETMFHRDGAANEVFPGDGRADM